MGFLGDLFDDVVEIASTPFKLGGKLVDDFMETDIEDWVNETKDAVKIRKGVCPRCKRNMVRYNSYYACEHCEHLIKV